MTKPLFSVIMPAYNAAEYIHASIESVLYQTIDDFELLIIDDASTDTTFDIIERYAQRDDRIKPFRLESNQGVAGARNLGIKTAIGIYIGFLDSDDLWLPHKLEVQLNIIMKHRVDVVYSAYVRFYPDGREKIVRAKEKIEYKDMHYGNPIGNLTGVYNQIRLGKHYQKPIGHEDYLMWINIVKKSRSAIGISVPLAKYRVRENSVSADKLRASIWVWNIYRRELNYSFVKSAKFWLGYTARACMRRLY